MRPQNSLKFLLNLSSFILFCIGAKLRPFSKILILVLLWTLLLKSNTIFDTRWTAILHCSVHFYAELWFGGHCSSSTNLKIFQPYACHDKPSESEVLPILLLLAITAITYEAPVNFREVRFSLTIHTIFFLVTIHAFVRVDNTGTGFFRSFSLNCFLFPKFFPTTFFIFLQHFILGLLLFPWFPTAPYKNITLMTLMDKTLIILMTLLFTAENDSATSLTSSFVPSILIVLFLLVKSFYLF